MKNLREFVLETIGGKRAYLPGDVIRGELFVTLEEQMEMKSLKVFFCGEGAGLWIEQSYDEGASLPRDSEGQIARKMLIDVGLLVFGFAGKDTKKIDTHEYGRYVYTFEFKIPHGVPSTFKSPAEKDLGYAKYYLKAVLQRPRKYDKVTKLTLVINALIDPDQPMLQFQPGAHTESNVKTACVSNGDLNLKSYLNRSYFTQGESILINAIGENDSTKVMKEMYAKLIRRVSCKSRFGTRTFTSEEAKVHGGRILPKENFTWKNHKMRVPPVGPTLIALPPHQISVDYIIRVGMYEDLGNEIHHDLHIVIGTLGTKDDIDGKNQNALKKEVEGEVLNRDNSNYGLQVVKASDRNDYRKVLKDRIKLLPEEIHRNESILQAAPRNKNEPVVTKPSANEDWKNLQSTDIITADGNKAKKRFTVFEDEINIASSDIELEAVNNLFSDEDVDTMRKETQNERKKSNFSNRSPLHDKMLIADVCHNDIPIRKTSLTESSKISQSLSNNRSKSVSPMRNNTDFESLAVGKLKKKKPKTILKKPYSKTDSTYHNKNEVKENLMQCSSPGHDLINDAVKIKSIKKPSNSLEQQSSVANEKKVKRIPSALMAQDEDQMQSEDELQVCGVDEEAFLQALGEEMMQRNKEENIESPIMPMKKIDTHANLDEEEFLREFERLEQAFVEESVDIKQKKIPTECFDDIKQSATLKTKHLEPRNHGMLSIEEKKENKIKSVYEQSPLKNIERLNLSKNDDRLEQEIYEQANKAVINKKELRKGLLPSMGERDNKSVLEQKTMEKTMKASGNLENDKTADHEQEPMEKPVQAFDTSKRDKGLDHQQEPMEKPMQTFEVSKKDKGPHHEQEPMKTPLQAFDTSKRDKGLDHQQEPMEKSMQTFEVSKRDKRSDEQITHETSKVKTEDETDDNTKLSITPWGIVGMIGRLLGKKKKDDAQSKSCSEENEQKPTTSTSDDNLTMTEEKITGEKITEEKMTEEKMTEEKMTGEKMTEEKMTEEKMTKEKMTEEKITEEKMTEEKMTEGTKKPDDGNVHINSEQAMCHNKAPKQQKKLSDEEVVNPEEIHSTNELESPNKKITSTGVRKSVSNTNDLVKHTEVQQDYWNGKCGNSIHLSGQASLEKIRKTPGSVKTTSKKRNQTSASGKMKAEKSHEASGSAKKTEEKIPKASGSATKTTEKIHEPSGSAKKTAKKSHEVSSSAKKTAEKKQEASGSAKKTAEKKHEASGSAKKTAEKESTTKTFIPKQRSKILSKVQIKIPGSRERKSNEKENKYKKKQFASQANKSFNEPAREYMVPTINTSADNHLDEEFFSQHSSSDSDTDQQVADKPYIQNLSEQNKKLTNPIFGTAVQKLMKTEDERDPKKQCKYETPSEQLLTNENCLAKHLSSKTDCNSHEKLFQNTKRYIPSESSRSPEFKNTNTSQISNDYSETDSLAKHQANISQNPSSSMSQIRKTKELDTKNAISKKIMTGPVSDHSNEPFKSSLPVKNSQENIKRREHSNSIVLERQNLQNDQKSNSKSLAAELDPKEINKNKQRPILTNHIEKSSQVSNQMSKKNKNLPGNLKLHEHGETETSSHDGKASHSRRRGSKEISLCSKESPRESKFMPPEYEMLSSPNYQTFPNVNEETSSASTNVNSALRESSDTAKEISLDDGFPYKQFKKNTQDYQTVSDTLLSCSSKTRNEPIKNLEKKPTEHRLKYSLKQPKNEQSNYPLQSRGRSMHLTPSMRPLDTVLDRNLRKARSASPTKRFTKNDNSKPLSSVILPLHTRSTSAPNMRKETSSYNANPHHFNKVNIDKERHLVFSPAHTKGITNKQVKESSTKNPSSKELNKSEPNGREKIIKKKDQKNVNLKTGNKVSNDSTSAQSASQIPLIDHLNKEYDQSTPAIYAKSVNRSLLSKSIDSDSHQKDDGTPKNNCLISPPRIPRYVGGKKNVKSEKRGRYSHLFEDEYKRAKKTTQRKILAYDSKGYPMTFSNTNTEDSDISLRGPARSSSLTKIPARTPTNISHKNALTHSLRRRSQLNSSLYVSQVKLSSQSHKQGSDLQVSELSSTKKIDANPSKKVASILNSQSVKKSTRAREKIGDKKYCLWNDNKYISPYRQQPKSKPNHVLTPPYAIESDISIQTTRDDVSENAIELKAEANTENVQENYLKRTESPAFNSVPAVATDLFGESGKIKTLSQQSQNLKVQNDDGLINTRVNKEIIWSVNERNENQKPLKGILKHMTIPPHDASVATTDKYIPPVKNHGGYVKPNADPRDQIYIQSRGLILPYVGHIERYDLSHSFEDVQDLDESNNTSKISEKCNFVLVPPYATERIDTSTISNESIDTNVSLDHAPSEQHYHDLPQDYVQEDKFYEIKENICGRNGNPTVEERLKLPSVPPQIQNVTKIQKQLILPETPDEDIKIDQPRILHKKENKHFSGNENEIHSIDKRIVVPVKYLPIIRAPTSQKKDIPLESHKRSRSVSPQKQIKKMTLRCRSASPQKTLFQSKKVKAKSIISFKDKNPSKEKILGTSKSILVEPNEKDLQKDNRMSKKTEGGTAPSQLQDHSLDISHDDKVVLGGGLIFNSHKKSMKSPRARKKNSNSAPYTKKSLMTNGYQSSTVPMKNSTKKCPPRSKARLKQDSIQEPTSLDNDNSQDDIFEKNLEYKLNVGIFKEPKTSCGFDGQKRLMPIQTLLTCENNQLNEDRELPCSKVKIVNKSKPDEKKVTRKKDTNHLTREEIKEKQKVLRQNHADKLFLQNELSKHVDASIETRHQNQSFQPKYEESYMHSTNRDGRDIVIKRRAPQSIVHPSSRPETLSAKNPSWYNDICSQRYKDMHINLLQVPRCNTRTKDESFDSFELHEKTFGIIDNHGKLIQPHTQVPKFKDKQNQRRRKKSKRFLDISAVTVKRSASCPAAIGRLENNFTYTNSHMSTVSSDTELEEDNQRTNTSDHGEVSRNKKDIEIRVKTVGKKENNVKSRQFGYEEEIIETYEFTEECPIE